MTLERELDWLRQNKADLLAHHRGQFAVIKDERLIGTYTTFEEAFDAGVKEVGNQPFLIRQITDEDIETIQHPALAVSLLYGRS